MFPYNDYRNYLVHHGIPGQKWGIRKVPWYPIADYEAHLDRASIIDKTDRKSVREFNTSKWGDSPNTNILYVTGSSGSGKSTIADKLAKNNKAKVIHLDLYTEEVYRPKNKRVPGQNLEFDNYCEKHFKDYRDLNDRKKVPNGTKEFGDLLDKLELAIEGYAKEQYKKGNKVIVEGIQLLDNTLYPDKKSLNGKPILVMKTGPFKSFIRAGLRDEKLNIRDLSPLDIYEYIVWYKYQYDNINNFIDKATKNSTFISGSSKTQFKDSEFYRKKLPSEVRKEIDKMIKNGDRINVGDAPGIDRQVQEYLKSKHYKNVHVYGPGTELRYIADKKWTQHPIDAPEFEKGSSEWLAKKDLAMERDSDSGLAITIKGGAGATRNNVDRLRQNQKPVKVYELDPDEVLDRWLSDPEIANIKLK